MKTIKLPLYNIIIKFDEENKTWYLTSDILGEFSDDNDKYLNPEDYREFRGLLDGIESLILALVCAGVDIETPEFLEGIETTIETIGNIF